MCFGSCSKSFANLKSIEFPGKTRRSIKKVALWQPAKEIIKNPIKILCNTRKSIEQVVRIAASPAVSCHLLTLQPRDYPNFCRVLFQAPSTLTTAATATQVRLDFYRVLFSSTTVGGSLYHEYCGLLSGHLRTVSTGTVQCPAPVPLLSNSSTPTHGACPVPRVLTCTTVICYTNGACPSTKSSIKYCCQVI